MKRRPLALTFYLILMCVLAASFPIQISYMQEVPLWAVLQLWQKLTWLNLLTMGLMIASGVFAFRASQKILLAAPLTIIVVGLNNWWVGHVGFDFSIWETSLATLGFVFTVAPLFTPKAFAAIKNQNIHWWRMAERKQVAIPVAIHPWVGDSVVSSTYDISETGAFVVLKNGNHLKIGDHLQMRLNIAGHIDIRCTAKLVRKAEAMGTYPGGMGIVFENLATKDREVLRHLVTR